MSSAVNVMLVLVCGLAWSWSGSSSASGDETQAPKPQVREISGIELGGKTPMVFVARDKATWDNVIQAVGKPQMLPIGMPKGQDLQVLGNIDFTKQMIVAVFWGQMSFSGHDEKCRIERVTVGTDEVVVDCRATLWGGAVDAAYRAWPYHAMVVDRSDLPVRFRQSTDLKADPKHSEKDKPLAIIAAKEWKQEANTGK